MTTKQVYNDIVTFIEALTPTTTVSDGELTYLYSERQADDLARDRGFILRAPEQVDANPFQAMPNRRWLTTFSLEMFHHVGNQQQNDIVRIIEDRDQLMRTVSTISNYTATYTDAVITDTVSGTTEESGDGVFRTVITFTVAHHEV